jgi:hypothetical protein
VAGKGCGLSGKIGKNHLGHFLGPVVVTSTLPECG